MTYMCEVDVNHSQSIYEFFKMLEEYGCGSVVGFIADGPGGGNPCVKLSFENRNDCVKFLMNIYCEDEENEFIKNQII